MFSKLIASAIAATLLTAGMSAPAHAFEGGGGSGDGPAFITMTNPDGSSVTVRGTKAGREITRRNRDRAEVRRVPKKGRSWAHNHTTGVTSVGVRPGVRIVISPFGIGLSF